MRRAPPPFEPGPANNDGAAIPAAPPLAMRSSGNNLQPARPQTPLATRLLTAAYAVAAAVTALFGGLCFGVYQATVDLIDDLAALERGTDAAADDAACKSRISLHAWQFLLRAKAVSAGFVVFIAIAFLCASITVCAASCCGCGLRKPRSRFSRGFLSGAALVIALFLAEVTYTFQATIPMASDLSGAVDEANSIVGQENQGNQQTATQINLPLLYSAVASGWVSSALYLVLGLVLCFCFAEDKTVAIKNEYGETIEIAGR